MKRFLCIIIILLAGITLHAQEVRRPSGRRALFPMASPTPTPGDVDCNVLCGVPGSLWCSGASLSTCAACWLENCGIVIATPTPVPTWTPTPTPTPQATPTPLPGQCNDQFIVQPGHPMAVYAVGYYIHESETEHGFLYRSNPPLHYYPDEHRIVAEHIGHPVAVEWYAKPQGAAVGTEQVVATCGVVPDSLVFELIFAHGFERGATKGWSRVVGETVKLGSE